MSGGESKCKSYFVECQWIGGLLEEIETEFGKVCLGGFFVYARGSGAGSEIVGG